MPTLEMNGKTVELNNTTSASDIPFVPKPDAPEAPNPIEAPSIKKPVTPAPTQTASKSTRSKPAKADKARTAKPVDPTTPEKTAERAKKVSEVLTITSGSLLLAGKTYSSKPLRADGHTLSVVTPSLAEAVANVAAVDPAVARLLDHEGSAKAAAYVGLVSVCMSLGAQVAANHGLVQPGFMSTASADDIIAALEPAEETADDNPTGP
jgi:hypothetical protein